jgi:hypothetical protein
MLPGTTITRMDDLLADLDHVDWAKLKHAYGRAGDVAGQLRALLSRAEERRVGQECLRLCGARSLANNE